MDAVLPLVLEHGRATSTRQIAEASGIAEGTIFRVFATKQELLDEVVRRGLSPDRVVDSLAALPTDGDLFSLVSAIVRVLREHALTTHRLISLLPPATDARHPDPHARRAAGERTVAAITSALAPHACSLGVPLTTAAGAIFALSFGSSFAPSGPLDPDAIATILLHGIARADRKA